MANANPLRIAQVNGAGDPRALFLKVYGGEVLTRFHRQSAFRERHMVRQLRGGKSAQFPVTGGVTAAYHTPGTEIVGTNMKANERVIALGDTLVAANVIPDIDEMLSQYDYRSIVSAEQGDTLTNAYDRNVARAFILAGRSPAIVDGLAGGGAITSAQMLTDGTILWNGIYNSGVILDTKDIPLGERTTWLRPVQHALVVQSEKPINRDLNEGSPNGSIARGTVEMINGIPLIKTNNLVFTDDRTNTDIPADQRGDFSQVAFLTAHRSAVGTVQAQDVTTEASWDPRRLVTLLTARYLTGHGTLRPEAVVEGRTQAPAA